MSPLVYHMLPFDPRAGGAMVAWIAFAGAAAGAVLWLFGSRFSQSLVTLLAVAIGAAIGLNLPRWFGWAVGAWATAVGGALIAGIAGYSLHTLWAGIALALVLAGWGMCGTLLWVGLPIDWIPSAKTPEMSWWNWALALWGALPEQTRHVGPMLAATGTIVGLTLGIVWTRLAVMALHSVVGVTMMVALGLLAIEFGRPSMLRIVPDQRAWQATTLAGLVLFGVLVQWRLATAPRPEKVESDDPPD